MTQSTHAAAAPIRSDWMIPAGLLLLSLVPAIAGVVRLTQLTGGAAITPANQRFFDAPWPVVLHILTVIPFSIVGAFQFARGFRRRHRNWHRAAGRVLVGLGLTAAASGLWMTLMYPWPEGDGVILYFVRLVFGAAMLVSITAGAFAVRRRDFATHGEWMLRGYAIGMGAGTQVLTHLPWFILAEGRPGEGPRAIMMTAGWVINVAIAEWVIRRARRGRRDRRDSDRRDSDSRDPSKLTGVNPASPPRSARRRSSASSS